MGKQICRVGRPGILLAMATMAQEKMVEFSLDCVPYFATQARSTYHHNTPFVMPGRERINTAAPNIRRKAVHFKAN